MAILITAPDAIPNLKDKYKIFLAGTIDMGNSEDWQMKVWESIRQHDNRGNFAVFNPRRPKWDDAEEQSITNGNFYRQVNWELECMERSDIILMYIKADSKSPISLLELGLHAKSKKLVVVCEEGFYRKGNVDVVCERFDIPNFKDLSSALNYILS